VELATSFLKPKGLLIAYKGEKIEEEISAIGRSAFGGKEIKEKNFPIKKKIIVKVSDFDLKRTIVIMEKTR
jgi:16S rRNA G527 N7-methylase RsmG